MNTVILLIGTGLAFFGMIGLFFPSQTGLYVIGISNLILIFMLSFVLLVFGAVCNAIKLSEGRR